MSDFKAKMHQDPQTPSCI